MIGRRPARALTGIGLLLASVAWTGWVLLQTVGDPTRSSRVAHAVLDDPVSRAVIADDLADALATAVNGATGARDAAVPGDARPPALSGDDPRLRAAVGAALDDPAVVTDLVDALAAQHANLLGVEPVRPVRIDTTRFVSAVASGVRPGDAALADRLLAATPDTVDLPAFEVPLVGPLRRQAIAWVPRLATWAAVCLLAAFVLGDRRRVARRAGAWAVGAGLAWVLAPRALVWLATQWSPEHGALVRAAVVGATGEITAVATLLVLGGLGALVASVVLGPLARASFRRDPPFGERDRARDRVRTVGERGAGERGRARTDGERVAPATVRWGAQDLTPSRPPQGVPGPTRRAARRRVAPPVPRPGEPYDHLA